MKRAALLATVAVLCLLAVADGAAAQSAPGAPASVSRTAGRGSLTISWTAPTNNGGSAITSYDVRHIHSNAKDKSADEWSLEGSIAPSDPLQHVITGLGDNTQYEVRVRAVNAVGAGNWSATVKGTPLDHGSTQASSTLARLDSTVWGRIDPETDADQFKVVLTETTDFWVFTTGPVDTEGELINSSGGTVTSNDTSEPGYQINFSIRRILNAGTYYVRVTSSTVNTRVGNYTLHIRGVRDPGGTADTATPVGLGGKYGGRVDSTSADDFFQFTTTRDSWLTLTAIVAESVDLVAKVLDSSGNQVYSYLTDHAYWSHRDWPWVSFEVTTFLTPGTYVFQVSERSTDSGGPYTLKVNSSGGNQKIQERCTALPSLLGEPLSGCQWHLKNTGRLQSGGAGTDINVESVWASTKGEGITVAVIDGGFELGHPDLVDNILADLNHSPAGDFLDPRESHGTSVAGLLAARDNGFGMVGVAPRASIYGSNMVRKLGSDGKKDEALVAEAALLHLQQTAVSSNSWGPPNTGRPNLAGAAWHAAVERGLNEGFGGKGTVYVFSAGNGGDDDYSSTSEFSSHYGVIAVCAVNYKDVRSPRSEKGSNLWVCAPSNHQRSKLPQIYTATNGGYTETFGGTSAAAPLVSGVVALMRSANPALTWRDVRLILAATARKNHASQSAWQTGGLQYGSTDTRYNFSELYGFGVVDAAAAVALGRTWSGLPPYRTLTVTSADTDKSIGDNSFTTTLAVKGNHIEFIEYVTINLDLVHDQFLDMTIELTAPSGSSVKLSRGRLPDRWQAWVPQDLTSSIKLGASRFLGEDPEGTWTLRVSDWQQKNSGTLNGWGLTFHGHGRKPVAPIIASVDSGNVYLNVAWKAPEDIGASAVTSYDLRYIRSDATDKADEQWTTKTGIWSAGDLVYELAALTLDVGYDVQVRAVNTAGAGPWSEVSTGQTMLVPPVAPAIDSVIATDAAFTVSWTAPARNGGAAITRYDVRSIRSDATDKADANWSVETAWSTGDGALQHTVSSINNNLEYDVEVRAANSVGDSPWSSTAVLQRNQRPKFPSTETGLRSVDENTPSGRAVGAPIAATDEEGDTRTYSILESGAAFSIDAASGQLRTKDPLNYETANTHTLIVQVSDGKDLLGEASADVDTTITVTIIVRDVNERPTADDDEIGIREDETGVVHVLDNDVDPDAGDTVTVRVLTSPRGTARVAADGAITYTPERDSTATDRFTYEVRDSGGLTDQAVVQVKITPMNDAPAFSSPTTTRTVAESAGEGVNVGAPVTATDVDRETLTYSLFGPPEFEIAEATGQITVARGATFNVSTHSEYTVTVEARDTWGTTASIAVTITIAAGLPPPPITGGGSGGGFGPAPVAPKFSDGFRTTRSVAQNARPGDAVGDPVLATHPEDLEILYSLSGTDAASFTVDEETGQIQVRAGVALDQGQTYTVNLTATDISGTGALIIVVINVTEATHHRYDLNRNGNIERDEVVAAVKDYFDGLMTKDEVIELVKVYFAESG